MSAEPAGALASQTAAKEPAGSHLDVTRAVPLPVAKLKRVTSARSSAAGPGVGGRLNSRYQRSSLCWPMLQRSRPNRSASRTALNSSGAPTRIRHQLDASHPCRPCRVSAKTRHASAGGSRGEGAQRVEVQSDLRSSMSAPRSIVRGMRTPAVGRSTSRDRFAADLLCCVSRLFAQATA